MTFDVIGQVALGEEFNTLADPASKIGHAWIESLESLMWKLFAPPYWYLYKTEYIRRSEEQLEYLERMFFDIIKKKQISGVEDNEETLLAYALRAQKENPLFTDEEIKTHMMTFLFAGHDTTSSALTWLFYFISIHPEVEKKVLAEIREVQSQVEGKMSEEGLNKLTYLTCVVRETLRICPSAPSLGRMIRETHTFQGVTIPANTPAGWSPYAVHHNSSVWKNPETFDPDRFLPENFSGMHPYAYVPFGGGPRRCIGEKLALKQMKLAVVEILPHFSFTPLPGHPVELVTRTTLFARYGVKMTVKRRQ